MNKAKVLKSMILRVPKHNPAKALPKIRRIQNKTTQAPVPLDYKLQDLPTNISHVADVITPLGLQQQLPFHVARTHVGNLPIYRKFSHGGDMKRTIIRLITGDVGAFKNELSKVVSNADIIEKVGRVEVKGHHKESVSHWLTRLGF